jgi:hypothetical protein
MTGSWPSCSTASRAADRKASIPVMRELMNTFMGPFYRRSAIPESLRYSVVKSRMGAVAWAMRQTAPRRARGRVALMNALSLREVVEGPFAKWMGTDDWSAWKAFLSALRAEPMSRREQRIYQEYTGRQSVPDRPFQEAWIVAGRRAAYLCGKPARNA